MFKKELYMYEFFQKNEKRWLVASGGVGELKLLVPRCVHSVGHKEMFKF